MHRSILVVLFLAATSHLHAAVQTKAVEYKVGDQTCEGFLAWDDAQTGPRPGVLVVHEWTGLGGYVKMRCRKLAELGYIAFAADIYGKGIRPATPQEAGPLAGKYKKDPPLMRARVRAALDVLRGNPLCDPKRTAAIGYCFGGTCVLELARCGADVSGVVSFHGGLSTANPADAKNIRGKVLVLHGADDPHVTNKEVEAFEDEMRTAGVDWQFNAYGGAVHGFTNPANGNDKARGVAYNAEADRRSWEAMNAFFGEIFSLRAGIDPGKAEAVRKRVAANLPSNWVCEVNHVGLVVRRADDPIIVNTINGPGPRNGQTWTQYMLGSRVDIKYRVVLRLSSKVEPNQVRQMLAHNRQIREEISALETKIRWDKGHPAQPQTPEEAVRVSKYSGLVQALKPVPDGFLDGVSVYIEPTNLGYASFFDKETKAECEAVVKKVAASLIPYPTDAGKSNGE